MEWLDAARGKQGFVPFVKHGQEERSLLVGDHVAMQVELHAQFLGQLIGPVKHRQRAATADSELAASPGVGRFEFKFLSRQRGIDHEDDRVLAGGSLGGDRQQRATAQVDVTANFLGREFFRKGRRLGVNDHGRCPCSLRGKQRGYPADHEREATEVAYHDSSPERARNGRKRTTSIVSSERNRVQVPVGPFCRKGPLCADLSIKAEFFPRFEPQ